MAQSNSYDKFFMFILKNKTLKPLELKTIILYYRSSKKSDTKDSIVLNYHPKIDFTDTVFIINPSKVPLFLKIKLEYTDISRISNEFYYFLENNSWEIFAGDTDLTVKPYHIRGFNDPNKSNVALILLLQTIIEILLAFMMSRMIGWSRTIIIMVLAANIITFPIYLFNISSVYLREAIVLGIKILSMSLIGFRKIAIYKIVIFAIILMFISLGIKEILFVLMRII